MFRPGYLGDIEPLASYRSCFLKLWFSKNVGLLACMKTRSHENSKPPTTDEHEQDPRELPKGSRRLLRFALFHGGEASIEGRSEKGIALISLVVEDDHGNAMRVTLTLEEVGALAHALRYQDARLKDLENVRSGHDRDVCTAIALDHGGQVVVDIGESEEEGFPVVDMVIDDGSSVSVSLRRNEVDALAYSLRAERPPVAPSAPSTELAGEPIA